MVATLLTIIALAVMQLGLALLVRNTVLDAAAEGARFAALAGNRLDDGSQRTRELIETAIGHDYAGDIRASQGQFLGVPSIEVRVVCHLPVIGLIGLPNGLEVTGYAPQEIIGGFSLP
jgi:hypothetical protein